MYDRCEKRSFRNDGVCPRNKRPCIQPGKTHDLYGFADIIAMKQSEGILAVQSTTVNNLSKHRKEILANPLAKQWVACGGRLFLIAWEKKHKRTKAGKATKKKYWTSRYEEFKLESFQQGGGGAQDG